MLQKRLSRVLISTKPTMITVGRYHGIRLYVREMQPHDLSRHSYYQTQPFFCRIFPDGEILIESFKFTNDYYGFYLLLSYLASLDQNSIIIGLESTKHYVDNLVRFFINMNYKAYVLNSIQASFMHMNNVHKTKAVRVGTFVITNPLMLQAFLCLITLENLEITSISRNSIVSAKSLRNSVHS